MSFPPFNTPLCVGFVLVSTLLCGVASDAAASPATPLRSPASAQSTTAADSASSARSTTPADSPSSAHSPTAQLTDTPPHHERIIGGTATGTTAYPWMAKLSVATPAGTYLCGATLVSPTRLLTAQHCLDKATKVTAYIGKANWTDGTVRTSSTFVRGGGVGKGDWAVITLATPVKGKVVALTSGTKHDAAATFRALGWGVTSTGNTSAMLQQVDLPSQKAGTYDCGTTNAEICAGVPKGGKDTCQGDSGGPLLAKSGSSWVQVGITSWGTGCAQAGNLGHYTRISTYLTQIKAAIR